MGIVMSGIEVAKHMKIELSQKVLALKERGIEPCLSIIRVGKKEEDLSYERGAMKRMEMLGISCQVLELPENIEQSAFENAFQLLNEDPHIHGILVFQPLPEHLDIEPIKNAIHPMKDVDGMCKDNVAKVFMGDKEGFAPCTAEAVMEILAHYEVNVSGKNVVVVGRSMVIGKPVSMLLLQENGTVTIAHSRTEKLPEVVRQADIVVAAVGSAKMITSDMISEDAIVVDVGINVDENGNLCGDVDFNEVEKVASMITPVPRGVGSVTTSVLAKHVIRAAEKLNK